MTDVQPAPLVPAEVDLTDFPYMPLDVRRLRDSRLVATSSGDSFMAWVLLLCASWHQKPAGSLPDDDVELAQLAGFGRVVKEWKKVRSGAMYGWVKCSDGRWYHPIVTDKALDAWEKRLLHDYKKECDRLRKENKRREDAKEETIQIPSFESWNAARNSVSVPTEEKIASDGTAEFSDGNPAENALIGRGRGRRKDLRISQEGGTELTTPPTHARRDGTHG